MGWSYEEQRAALEAKLRCRLAGDVAAVVLIALLVLAVMLVASVGGEP